MTLATNAGNRRQPALPALTEQEKAHKEAAWHAAWMEQSDKYRELLADGAWHASKEDWQSASRSCREAINLDVTLGSSRRIVGAAQLFLEFLVVPGGQGALSGRLEELGSGHGRRLRNFAAERVRRGGQTGVVER